MAVDQPAVFRTRVYPEFARTSYLVYGLILSIAIFFIGAILAFAGRYLLSSEPFPIVKLPPIFVASTALLFAGSHSLFRSYRAIRLERQYRFQMWISIALLMATLFCVLQCFGMSSLLEQHWREAVGQSNAAIAVMLMVFLHIAHFGAGLICLAFVCWQGFRGRYDHEYNNGVRLAAIYWRFLDLVWIAMLGTFALMNSLG